LCDTGRLHEALQVCEKYLTDHPGNLRARQQRAALLFELQRYSKALERIDELIADLPIAPALCHLRGNVLEKMGNHGAALRAYDDALNVDNHYCDAWNDNGYLLKRLGLYAEALDCYYRAVECDPQNWTTWGNLGSLLGMLGRHEASLECSEKSLAINPANQYARHNRDQALRALGSR